MDALDTAIDSVNKQRSNIGSYINRLEHSVTNLKNSVLNMQAAESQVRDVDVGNEMANFTRLQILSQAGTSMLSQANQTTQGAMSLFR
jgi:flagellin